GATIPAIDYIRALRIRELLRHELRNVLDTVDAIVLPTVPITAYQEKATTVQIDGAPEDAIKAMTQYTSLFNLTGSPALSVPVGLSSDALPIGLQIVSRERAEDVVLRVGQHCEWHADPRVAETRGSGGQTGSIALDPHAQVAQTP